MFPVCFRIGTPNSEVCIESDALQIAIFWKIRAESPFDMLESKLDTHDVNLPLPSPGAPGTRYLRFLLLSPADQVATTRQQRIERLENQSGGSDAAIIWLMGEGDDQSSYLQFQIE